MAGRESSYFLFFDGSVASCGQNDEGRLGDGTFTDRDKTSVLIPNDEKIIALGSGPSSQSVFFICDVSLYKAGANDRYQLGLGLPGKIAYPTAVDLQDPGFDIMKISSSGTHTVAVVRIFVPTLSPTTSPSISPSVEPTVAPTLFLTLIESVQPSGRPSPT
jgi:alpha-tubulin suppressor-like RCC1 family protein